MGLAEPDAPEEDDIGLVLDELEPEEPELDEADLE